MSGLFVFGIFEFVEGTTKDKNPNALNWRDYVIIALVAAAFSLLDNTHDDTLNYPEYLTYLLSIVLFGLVVVIFLRAFKKRIATLPSLMSRLIYMLVSLTVGVFGAITVANILLAPFNYYNTYNARKAPAVVVFAQIDSVSVGRLIPNNPQPNTIYYHFQEKPYAVTTKDFGPLLANMRAFYTFDQYRLKLVLHPSLLGSYWIEDWKIVQNSDNKPPQQ